MDVGMIITLVVIILVVVVLGGGVMILLFMGSKKNKQVWRAKVYQLGDGVVKVSRKKKSGERVGYCLSELKPYTVDQVIKIDKKDGATHYWLTKLQKPTPVVTADCVEVFGQNEKEVKVLLEEDSCTLLKMGYDRKLGEMIFRPMDHDRINMIKTELSERNARIENTKDVLAAITPFVVAGIAMIGLVCIAYFVSQAGIKIAEFNNNMNLDSIKAQKDIASMYIQGINDKLKDPQFDREIIKEEAPLIVPP